MSIKSLQGRRTASDTRNYVVLCVLFAYVTQNELDALLSDSIST